MTFPLSGPRCLASIRLKTLDLNRANLVSSSDAGLGPVVPGIESSGTVAELRAALVAGAETETSVDNVVEGPVVVDGV